MRLGSQGRSALHGLRAFLAPTTARPATPAQRRLALATACRHQPCSQRTLSTTAGAAAAGSSPAASSAAPGAMIVERIPALNDNYVWLLHDSSSGVTAVVDPAVGPPVERLLNERGWKLSIILNTHHHHDHTGANLELKKKHGATIIGPRADAARIPGIDQQVGDGDTFHFGGVEVRVFDTPGHTRGHITYWMPGAEAMFPGDTLFALGCGRMFEGNPPQFWGSLAKLAELPRETRVYCAHEYTLSNAKFAAHIDPGNGALGERKKEVERLRGLDMPTVPSTLGEELDTNPFLRPQDPSIRAKLGFDASAPDHEVFGALRAAKDSF